MSIRIDSEICIGCRQCKEVCPGSLIKMNEEARAYIKYHKDCWGCTSCLKECPVHAIKFYLGADIGGRGSCIHIDQEKDLLHWVIEEADGTVKTIEIDKKKANAY